ncbi:MAG TPA: hypothetical protein VMT16_03640 [Thermoanaerobaculia bacterium]|nr:hypothetical protein [Thermoanaerobaculia bacterium]
MLGDADALLDELLPEGFPWKRMVRRYPRTAVAVAAAAGFWLGRARGDVLLATLGALAAAQASEAAAGLLGK